MHVPDASYLLCQLCSSESDPPSPPRAQEACREKEARERGDKALEREKAAREKEASSRRERELQLRHLVKLSRSMESAKDK